MTVDQVRQAVTAAAARYGVDPAFALAVAERESSLGRNAGVSPVGAIGIMQLMPETARSLGVDPYNEAQNIDGGVRMLAQLLNTYHGDKLQTVAAYNWGSGNLASGRPMPAETADYVSWIARRFGIDTGSTVAIAGDGAALDAWLAEAGNSGTLPEPLIAALALGAGAALLLVFA
jgi:soluble lytic murein transglycosylase-like protein